MSIKSVGSLFKRKHRIMKIRMGEKLLVNILSFLAGAGLTHLWKKFKNRLSIIKYTVHHQYLGASTDDQRFGSVKVLYNNNSVKNLYLSTILLSNESSRDLANLELNITCDATSAILISYGKNRASLKELSFTEKYANALAGQGGGGQAGGNPEVIKYIFQRRDYMLPVINRGDKVDFLLLTTSFEGKQPVLAVGCDSPGLRMEFTRTFPELFGEPQTQSTLVGALAALILCAPIIYFISNKSIAVLISVLVGLFAFLWGVLLLKFYKLVVKILS